MQSMPVGQYDPTGFATKGDRNMIREGMTAVVTGGAQGLSGDNGYIFIVKVAHACNGGYVLWHTEIDS